MLSAPASAHVACGWTVRCSFILSFLILEFKEKNHSNEFFLLIELFISCVLLANSDVLCHLGTNHHHPPIHTHTSMHVPTQTHTHKHTHIQTQIHSNTKMHTQTQTHIHFINKLVLSIKVSSLTTQLLVSLCSNFGLPTLLIQTSGSNTCFLSCRIPLSASQCLCFLSMPVFPWMNQEWGQLIELSVARYSP